MRGSRYLSKKLKTGSWFFVTRIGILGFDSNHGAPTKHNIQILKPNKLNFSFRRSGRVHDFSLLTLTFHRYTKKEN